FVTPANLRGALRAARDSPLTHSGLACFVIRGAAVTRNLEPILVVGGGLGGAAVSLALARKGFRVRLIEQAPEFGVIGYGIQLGPNVFPMFDRLGITEAVMKAALRPRGVRMLDSVDGETIAHFPTGASFVERFKHP